MTSHLSTQIVDKGWATVQTGIHDEDELVHAMSQIASDFGDIVSLRNGRPTERLVPHTADSSIRPSLSTKYGLGQFPLHFDASHRIIPWRYIFIACLQTSRLNVPTILLDSNHVSTSDTEKNLIRSALFSIRNGRQSFYSTIASLKRPFMRVDPGCMEPTSDDAATALDIFNYGRHAHKASRITWKVGDLLVIDNWRVLHGRGDSKAANDDRVLLRMVVE